ncbi:MAG: D-glucuronyl C5-epimerase family protein [Candidatus Desantisbacteria bacterium]
MSKLNYYKRIFTAYLTNRKSHLTFWHGIPQVNENFKKNELQEYYMSFISKADYQGDYDDKGIPMLNYHGTVGLQYNPIAIAQYGLGNYDLFCHTNAPERYRKFMDVADWLVTNLEQNSAGLWVWNHHFNWEYRDTLKSPWYSALSQGQGISVLVRAYKETQEKRYLESAEKAFESFNCEVNEGGVKYVDDNGYIWFEEAIVDPPTHILNGFLWALWGIHDYFLLTKQNEVKELFNEGVRTLEKNLQYFDMGFWSLYEQSGTRLKMIASPFYHSLHIVQLKIMSKLTERVFFKEYAEKWEGYQKKMLNRILAVCYKALFKLIYY